MTPQSIADALAVTLEEGIKKRSVALIREVISLLEAQGQDCADAKDKLREMVFSYHYLISFISASIFSCYHFFLINVIVVS